MPLTIESVWYTFWERSAPGRRPALTQEDIRVTITRGEHKGRALASLGAALTLGLGIFGMATAGASTLRAQATSFSFTGAVVSTGQGSFSVLRAGNPVTVEVFPHTAYGEAGKTGVSFMNIQAGDRVKVEATLTSSTTTFNALQVQIETFPTIEFNATVTSLGSSSFAAVRPSGVPINVEVSTGTLFKEAGVAAPTLSDVVVGQSVTVRASMTTSTKVVDASQIQIRPFPGVYFNAKVRSIGAKSFQVFSSKALGAITVEVTSSTTYKDPLVYIHAVTTAQNNVVRATSINFQTAKG
jgi:Domain of unknown function (DUF5666)